MAIRHEQLNDEECARQAALDRSWQHAQTALADPEFRAYVERSIARVNASPSRATLTREQFLAQTEADAE